MIGCDGVLAAPAPPSSRHDNMPIPSSKQVMPKIARIKEEAPEVRNPSVVVAAKIPGMPPVELATLLAMRAKLP